MATFVKKALFYIEIDLIHPARISVASSTTSAYHNLNSNQEPSYHADTQIWSVVDMDGTVIRIHRENVVMIRHKFIRYEQDNEAQS